MARAPWWQVVGQRGMAWRASSGGGGDRLVAQREVRSTGGAHGGVSGVVLDTLPDTTALSTRWSQPMLDEGVSPAAQLDRALEAQRHGSSTMAARSRGACSAQLEEQSDGRASREEKNIFISSMDCSGG
jgi:hypothetical protein